MCRCGAHYRIRRYCSGIASVFALAGAPSRNLLILGAASNVIIIQRAERHGETLDFMEFARTGIPVTCINLLVYALYLRWLN
jgi:Na+/H+ antiporter NhaD/arsenite permease-like protein